MTCKLLIVLFKYEGKMSQKEEMKIEIVFFALVSMIDVKTNEVIHIFYIRDTKRNRQHILMKLRFGNERTFILTEVFVQLKERSF
jgi:hypothetical protein